MSQKERRQKAVPLRTGRVTSLRAEAPGCLPGAGAAPLAGCALTSPPHAAPLRSSQGPAGRLRATLPFAPASGCAGRSAACLARGVRGLCAGLALPAAIAAGASGRRLVPGAAPSSAGPPRPTPRGTPLLTPRPRAPPSARVSAPLGWLRGNGMLRESRSSTECVWGRGGEALLYLTKRERDES